MTPFNKSGCSGYPLNPPPEGHNRRTFLVRAAWRLERRLLGMLPLSCMRQATTEEKRNFPQPGVQTEYRRTSAPTAPSDAASSLSCRTACGLARTGL